MRLDVINGTEIYKDIRLGHTWFEVGVLKSFLSPYFYNYTFIEIGIHEGGLSALLINEFSKYIGVELNCNLIRPEVKALYNHPNYELICGDCFSDFVYQKLYDLRSKIIYCDGGHKALEINHFAGTCTSGDILLSHDFWDGCRNVYTVDNVVPEVTLNDIENLETNKYFKRLSENIFRNTRIIGWEKL